MTATGCSSTTTEPNGFAGSESRAAPREVLKSCSTPTLMGILGGDFVLFPWRGQILDGLLHVLFDGFVECFPVACLQQIQ